MMSRTGATAQDFLTGQPPRCLAASPRGLNASAPSAFLRCQQPVVERLRNGGRAIADPELGVDVEQVGLDGRLADEQSCRRVAVCGRRVA
jgi:hypothetical protein